MRYVAIGLLFVLGLWPAPAQARVAVGTNLTVLLSFDREYSDPSIQEMAREIEHLLRRTGVNLNIRKKSEMKEYEDFEDLVLVRFQGACSMNGTAQKAPNGGPLGWSHVMSGEILPFGDVSCDNVRQAVSGVLWGEQQNHRERLFGRALGRVVAHELYHIIGGVHSHGKKGIAQASLSGQELIAEEMEIALEDMERMLMRPRILASYRTNRQK